MQEYGKLYGFLVCLFFSLHMYNSKLVTDSQIIAGVHLMKKKGYQTIRCDDWFDTFSL